MKTKWIAIVMGCLGAAHLQAATIDLFMTTDFKGTRFRPTNHPIVHVGDTVNLVNRVGAVVHPLGFDDTNLSEIHCPPPSCSFRFTRAGVKYRFHCVLDVTDVTAEVGEVGSFTVQPDADVLFVDSMELDELPPSHDP